MPIDRQPPSGFSARPATLDDVAAITALMAESAQEAIGESDVTASEVSDGLGRSFVDLARDTTLVFDREARLVGYGEVLDEHPERAFVDVYLSPSLRADGYRRLGRWLVERCLERAEEFVVASGRRDVPVGAGCYRDEERLAEVLRSGGFRHVRTFWRMSLALDDSSLVPPPLPDGVTIRALDVDDEEDARLAHRLATESFRGHFGEVEVSAEQFWQEQRSRGSFDPTQWWVAEVAGAPAGLLHGDDRRVHENVGWVRMLGVLDEYRGRGLGRSLLQHAFAEFRRRGRERAMLAVDSENATGATALYESIGMTAVLVTDAYQLTVPR